MDRFCLAATLAASLLGACAPMPPAGSTQRVLGPASALGQGRVAAYAELDRAGGVQAIGVVFSGGALDGLPTEASDGRHCFDANQDRRIDLAHECSGGHERVLHFPGEAGRRADLPFKWVQLNWNPHGHIPPGVYDKPHFDVHFHLSPVEQVMAIEPGPCGPERVNCEHFRRARLPLPANYMPPDFKDVEAVAPAMGNHLVDPSAPEFRGTPFTRTWIYGTYDGRLSFFEEMVTRAYLQSGPDACFSIKAPPAVEVAGRYPTRSCLRAAKDRSEYTVSLEGFERREASPPAR